MPICLWVEYLENKINPIVNLFIGKSYTIQTGNENFIGSLLNSMSDIEQQEFEQIEFTDYESYFQYFAAFGFIFLLLDFLIPNGKTAKKTSIDIFSNSDDHDTSN